MPQENIVYTMIQTKPDGVLVAGLTYFTSWEPWREYRLSGAIHISAIQGTEAYYVRQKYRQWGNFYKLEPQYTSPIMANESMYLTDFFKHPGYRVAPIKNNDCIFDKNDVRYIIGKIAGASAKIHALRLITHPGWNGADYTAPYYFCSDVEMSRLTEAMFERGNGGVTMDLDMVKKQTGIITCSNCLRKLA